MVAVESWGRLSRAEHDVRYLSDRRRIASTLAATRPGLPRGNGRSYGDLCLNPGRVLWDARGLDRFIAFDDRTGVLTCEAGVLLRDIQRLAIPRGWILPVTPGTQLITVGGAIASDVHGKNHHAVGSFGDHVRRMTLLRTDGETIECGPDLQAPWFAASVGGMGLTGVVSDATLQLKPVAGASIDAETIPFDDLDAFFSLADASEAAWEHTVAWIDCGVARGRGVFMRGNAVRSGPEVAPPPRALRLPIVPPVSLVNRWSLRPFNAAYYRLKKRNSGRSVVPYESFFYPLDHVLEWNRLYGPRGFYQYQSVVPRTVGAAATSAMLAAIARSGEGSFLAVLKTFGDRTAPGMMSFPRPGVTLALDFANRGAATERLFGRLDDIVREAGGRLYAAKDARMPRDLFESGYPELPRFLPYRDPGIGSALSRRLLGS